MGLEGGELGIEAHHGGGDQGPYDPFAVLGVPTPEPDMDVAFESGEDPGYEGRTSAR